MEQASNQTAPGWGSCGHVTLPVGLTRLNDISTPTLFAVNDLPVSSYPS